MFQAHGRYRHLGDCSHGNREGSTPSTKTTTTLSTTLSAATKATTSGLTATTALASTPKAATALATTSEASTTSTKLGENLYTDERVRQLNGQRGIGFVFNKQVALEFILGDQPDRNLFIFHGLK